MRYNENVINAHGYLVDGRVAEEEMPDEIVAIKESVNFRGQAGLLYSDVSSESAFRSSTPDRLARSQSLGLASPVGIWGHSFSQSSPSVTNGF